MPNTAGAMYTHTYAWPTQIIVGLGTFDADGRARILNFGHPEPTYTIQGRRETREPRDLIPIVDEESHA